MANRVHFDVSFLLPEGATVDAAMAYVKDAVQSWRGSLEPPGADLGDGTFADGDPMSALNPDTVEVSKNYVSSGGKR